MPWVSFSDDFADRPDVVRLSDRAFRVHVSGLIYSGRHLTDGLVPVALVKTWGKTNAAEELIGAGLWVEQGDDYFIPDFLLWNQTRAEVEQRRSKTAEQRSQAGRANADKAKRGPDGTFQRKDQRPDGGADGPPMAPTNHPIAFASTPALAPEKAKSMLIEGRPDFLTDDQRYLIGRLIDEAPEWSELLSPNGVKQLRWKVREDTAALTEALQHAADNNLAERPGAWLTAAWRRANEGTT